MIHRVIRGLFFLAGAAVGFGGAYTLARTHLIDTFLTTGIMVYVFLAAATLIVGLISFHLAPAVMRGIAQAASATVSTLQRMPIQELVGGALGLIVGLVIATLFGYTLNYVPVIGGYVAVLVSVALGYVGLILGIKRREEILAIFRLLPKASRERERTAANVEVPANLKILDTSVIIDGRIADICSTGFVEGMMVVPSFVLEELRHIADSADLLKRSRGRRGLDILNEMRKDPRTNVEVFDVDFEDLAEVDTKLVRLAQQRQAAILTNDYNLNKVAELQGVKVLNINELANAVKPVVLPGEDMELQVIKDGKEIGQGVGYLDDGTMVVVDGGRRYIGQAVGVTVTSVFQTAAGRMIFAKLQGNGKRSFAGEEVSEDA